MSNTPVKDAYEKFLVSNEYERAKIFKTKDFRIAWLLASEDFGAIEKLVFNMRYKFKFKSVKKIAEDIGITPFHVKEFIKGTVEKLKLSNKSPIILKAEYHVALEKLEVPLTETEKIYLNEIKSLEIKNVG